MLYGYGRVSTKKQEKEGSSLSAQIERLVQAGVSRENIYLDAYTGTTMHRPNFDALMGKLKAGDELVCCKLDRFSRTVIEGAETMEKLLDMGAESDHKLAQAILFIWGNMLVRMMLCVAEFEKDTIVERTQNGRAYKRATDPTYREGRKRKEIEYKTLEGESIGEACKRLGVSRSTWYRNAV